MNGRLKSLHLDHALPLVIVGTSGPDTAFTYFRFKRLAFP